jgi:hypothetical protein
VSEHKRLLERLGSLIPGFRGYADRERRRDSDRALRDAVVTRLNDYREHVDRAITDCSSRMQFDSIELLERLKRRIESVRDTVRHAPAGYSGFFDTHQVREEDLEGIYAHDLQLREQADRVAERLLAINGGGDTRAACEQAMDAVTEFEQTLRRRDGAVTGNY